MDIDCTRIRDADGDFWLVEAATNDIAPLWGWGRQGPPEGDRQRFLIPCMLVGEEAIETLREMEPGSAGHQGAIPIGYAFSKIYAEACARHGAMLGMPGDGELPSEPWADETRITGTCEIHSQCDHLLLVSEVGRWRIRKAETPEQLRNAIRNGMRGMAGQYQAALARRRHLIGPGATPLAAWVLERLRPDAARRFALWCAESTSYGHSISPLVLSSADIETDLDIRSIRFTYGRMLARASIMTRHECIISERTITKWHLNWEPRRNRKGQPATAVFDHPLLEGRTITGMSTVGVRESYMLDIRPPVALDQNPVGIQPEDHDVETEERELLACFSSVTPFARQALLAMEPSQRLSRLAWVAERRVPEIPFQGPARPRTDALRLVPRGDVLDCTGPLSKSVFWNGRTLRIEGLPDSVMIRMRTSLIGHPASEAVDMPGLDALTIKGLGIAPETELRHKTLVLRLAA